MGKVISKFVFMPPKRKLTIDKDEEIHIPTSRNNLIQVKYINKFAKFNLLISHGNAEDIYMTYEWAEKVMVRFVNVNVMTYGNFKIMIQKSILDMVIINLIILNAVKPTYTMISKQSINI